MFCVNCGTQLSDSANFCPNCGMRRQVAHPIQPRCPLCSTVVNADAAFCHNCGTPLRQASQPGAQQQVQPARADVAPAQNHGAYYAPVAADAKGVYAQQTANAFATGPAPAYDIPSNVVPKKIVGKRTILTNRSFTHEELLQFMQQRWDAARYNQIVLDPRMKGYTDRYVVLPATNRHMIIVYSRDEGGLFSKDNKVVLSMIYNPDMAAQTMVMAIPTSNIFFGAAKLQNIKSEKQDREGPTEEALQKYADYMHFLLQQAGYLKGQS